jgi:hypothetical protein
MLVKRADEVQILCHSIFECSLNGLRVNAPFLRTILELR